MAGFAIGWIVWVGSVTVAPIEVLAVTTYLVQWFPWMMVEHGSTEVLTAMGIVFSVALMGVFTIIHDLEGRHTLPRRDRAYSGGLPPFQLHLPGRLRPVRDHRHNRGNWLLPFGIDINIVAAFSVAIYYYAMYVRLTPEEVRQHVAQARSEAEEEEGISI